MARFVKICGVTSVDDARVALDAGADAVGVNLVAGTPREVDSATAAAISRAVGERALVVGVVADRPLEELVRLRAELALGALQLHGDEPPELLRALLPNAYKALRIGSARDVAAAERYPGDRLLVDARVEGRLGGTGRSFDWSLVAELARRRRLMLAGGLDPDNVAAAIAAVDPWGVDVASGVERPGEPRRKDPERVAAFVRRARASTSRR